MLFISCSTMTRVISPRELLVHLQLILFYKTHKCYLSPYFLFIISEIFFSGFLFNILSRLLKTNNTRNELLVLGTTSEMDYATRISVKTNKERKRGSFCNLLLILSVETCYIAIF